MGITVGARDLRARVAEILQSVQEGETVTVTNRGRPVAEIRPVRNTRAGAADQAFGMWAERSDLEEVHGWLRKGRRSRSVRSS